MHKNLKHGEITGKIIQAAFAVHTHLGNGFQEVIYSRALSYEMLQLGLNFHREQEQDIFYKDLPNPIGTRRADFVVEEKVLVELKAVILLDDIHTAQILNYMKVYRHPVALLINFGCKSMEFKGFVLDF